MGNCGGLQNKARKKNQLLASTFLNALPIVHRQLANRFDSAASNNECDLAAVESFSHLVNSEERTTPDAATPAAPAGSLPLASLQLLQFLWTCAVQPSKGAAAWQPWLANLDACVWTTLSLASDEAFVQSCIVNASNGIAIKLASSVLTSSSGSSLAEAAREVLANWSACHPSVGEVDIVKQAVEHGDPPPIGLEVGSVPELNWGKADKSPIWSEKFSGLSSLVRVATAQGSLGEALVQVAECVAGEAQSGSVRKEFVRAVACSSLRNFCAEILQDAAAKMHTAINGMQPGKGDEAHALEIGGALLVATIDTLKDKLSAWLGTIRNTSLAAMTLGELVRAAMSHDELSFTMASLTSPTNDTAVTVSSKPPTSPSSGEDTSDSEDEALKKMQGLSVVQGGDSPKNPLGKYQRAFFLIREILFLALHGYMPQATSNSEKRHAASMERIYGQGFLRLSSVFDVFESGDQSALPQCMSSAKMADDKWNGIWPDIMKNAADVLQKLERMAPSSASIEAAAATLTPRQLRLDIQVLAENFFIPEPDIEASKTTAKKKSVASKKQSALGYDSSDDEDDDDKEEDKGKQTRSKESKVEQTKDSKGTEAIDDDKGKGHGKGKTITGLEDEDESSSAPEPPARDESDAEEGEEEERINEELEQELDEQEEEVPSREYEESNHADWRKRLMKTKSGSLPRKGAGRDDIWAAVLDHSESFDDSALATSGGIESPPSRRRSTPVSASRSDSKEARSGSKNSAELEELPSATRRRSQQVIEKESTVGLRRSSEGSPRRSFMRKDFEQELNDEASKRRYPGPSSVSANSMEQESFHSNESSLQESISSMRKEPAKAETVSTSRHAADSEGCDTRCKEDGQGHPMHLSGALEASSGGSEVDASNQLLHVQTQLLQVLLQNRAAGVATSNPLGLLPSSHNSQSHSVPEPQDVLRSALSGGPQPAAKGQASADLSSVDHAQLLAAALESSKRLEATTPGVAVLASPMSLEEVAPATASLASNLPDAPFSVDLKQHVHQPTELQPPVVSAAAGVSHQLPLNTWSAQQASDNRQAMQHHTPSEHQQQHPQPAQLQQQSQMPAPSVHQPMQHQHPQTPLQHHPHEQMPLPHMQSQMAASPQNQNMSAQFQSAAPPATNSYPPPLLPPTAYQHYQQQLPSYQQHPVGMSPLPMPPGVDGPDSPYRQGQHGVFPWPGGTPQPAGIPWPSPWPIFQGPGTQMTLGPGIAQNPFSHSRAAGPTIPSGNLLEDIGSLRNRVDQLQAAMDEAETLRPETYSNSNQAWASHGPQQVFPFAPALRAQQNAQVIGPGGVDSRGAETRTLQDQRGNTPLVNINFGGNSTSKDALQISQAPTMPQSGSVKSDDEQIKSDESRKNTPKVASARPETGDAPLESARLQDLEERLQDLSQNLSSCQKQLQMQQTTNSMLVQELLLARKERSRVKHRDPPYIVRSNGPDLDSGAAVPMYGQERATNGMGLLQKTAKARNEAPTRTAAQSSEVNPLLVKNSSDATKLLNANVTRNGSNVISEELSRLATPWSVEPVSSQVLLGPLPGLPITPEVELQFSSTPRSAQASNPETPRLSGIDQIHCKTPLLRTAAMRTPRASESREAPWARTVPAMPRHGLPLPSVWSAGPSQRSWQNRLREIDGRLEALDARFQCMRL